MSDFMYPILDETTVKGVLKIRKAGVDVLDSPKCKYPAGVKSTLKGILEATEKEIRVEVPKLVEKIVYIEKAARSAGKKGPKTAKLSGDIDIVAKEIEDIRLDLRGMKIEQGMTTSERIQVLKTQTALVEKLLAMAERSTNVKKTSAFMSTVMTILDDLVPDDVRMEFMRRIEPFAEKEDE